MIFILKTYIFSFVVAPTYFDTAVPEPAVVWFVLIHQRSPPPLLSFVIRLSWRVIMASVLMHTMIRCHSYRMQSV